MAITFRSDNSSYTAGTSTTVTLPSGVNTNDIMIAMVSAYALGGVPSIGTPSGWTQIDTASQGGNSRGSIFWKRATTSGGSQEFTSSGGSSNQTYAYVMAFYGASADDNPIAAYSSTQHTDYDTTFTGHSITPNEQPTMLVAVGGTVTTSITCSPAAGWTEQHDSDSGYMHISSYTQRVTSSSATGDIAFTVSTSISNKSFWLISIKENSDNEFGCHAILTSTSISTSYKRAVKYSLSQAATIDKLYIYMAGDGVNSGNIKMAVYDDDGTSNYASTRLGVTSEVAFTSGQSPGWTETTLTSPLYLTAGDYWLGFIGSAAFNGYSNATTGGTARNYNSETYNASTSPANPFGTPTNNANYDYSVYAHYTTSVACTVSLVGALTATAASLTIPTVFTGILGTTDTNDTSTVTASWGYIICAKWTLPVNSEFSKMSVFGCSDATGHYQPIRVAIYANNAGALGALKSVSPEFTITYNGGVQKWWDTYIDRVALTAGDYWLLIWGGDHTNGTYQIPCIGGSTYPVYYYNWATYDSTDSPPDPGGTITLSASYNPCIYASNVPSPMTVSAVQHETHVDISLDYP